MCIAPVLILAAAVSSGFRAYNVFPDAGSDVQALTLSENENGFDVAFADGQALYAVSLPNGWTRADLDMHRPLARFRAYSTLMKRKTGRSAGILVRGAPEGVPDGDTGLPDRLRTIGESLSQAAPAFIFLDGVFAGMDETQALAAARAFRSGIDAVNPAVNAGYAMTAAGRSAAPAVAAALAAQGCRPVLRLDNADCLETSVKGLPTIVWATMSKTACPTEPACDFLDDADAFPYNLWGKSATGMHLKTTASLMCGARGALYWSLGVCGPDGFPMHANYLAMLRAKSAFYNELVRTLEGSRLQGVSIPAARADFGLTGGNWAELMFGSFGIPFAAAYEHPADGVSALMSAESVKSFTDGELMRILSGKVLVDGDAAVALSVRGFADWMGADVRLQDLPFNCEMDGQGGMIRFGHEPLTPSIVTLPSNDVQVLTWLVHRNGITGEVEKIAPGSTLFTNPRGGTVLVTAFHCKLPEWNVLNEARKVWLVSALERLNGGRLPFLSGDNQDVLALTRRLADGSTVAWVANLGFDPIESPAFLFSVPPKRIQYLKDDGTWCDYRPAPLKCAECVVLRF